MYAEDDDDELLILRPVGPGIQDLETGDMMFAASYSGLKPNGRYNLWGPIHKK